MHYLYDHHDYDDKFLKFALTKSFHRGIHNIHTVARGSILKLSLSVACDSQWGILTHAKDYQEDVRVQDRFRSAERRV